MTDTEALAQARHQLRADAPWQERVDGVRLLGQTDPTSSAGQEATALMADICLHDVLIQAIEEAGYALMTGGPDRVEAYLRAWDEADGAVAGWMDNCLGRLTQVKRLDDHIAERQLNSPDPDVREIAQDWRVYHGFPSDPRDPLPPRQLSEFVLNSEHHHVEGWPSSDASASTPTPAPATGDSATWTVAEPAFPVRPGTTAGASIVEDAMGNPEHLLSDLRDRLDAIVARARTEVTHGSSRDGLVTVSRRGSRVEAVDFAPETDRLTRPELATRVTEAFNASQRPAGGSLFGADPEAAMRELADLLDDTRIRSQRQIGDLRSTLQQIMAVMAESADRARRR